MEETQQGIEDMNCNQCTVEHDLKSYITIKTLLISAFALLAPVTALFMFVINDAVSDTKRERELKILPMIEKDKQCIARIIRLENQQSESQKTSVEILNIVRDIKTDLKYNVPTKKEMRTELALKVDLDKLNKQYMNK